MKITYKLLSLTLGFSAFGAMNVYSETPKEISLESVSSTVRNRNYNVLMNAMKMYQAKESISVARGNLLPKLNIWKIAEAIVDPGSLIGMIQDIAPFLVPANWFRVEQNKILYRAEMQGYRALWGNELLTAKSLYLQVLLDQALMNSIHEAVLRHQELEDIVKVREMMGSVPRGSTRAIQIRKLALESDYTEMQVLLKKERQELTFALGLSSRTPVVLRPVSLINIAAEKPLNSADYVSRVLQSSPELRQYAEIINALPSVKREVYFSFLGASTASRGVAGGVFDHLPLQEGLGFGSGASLRIIRKESQILEIQMEGLKETLARQLNTVIDRNNADLDQYDNLLERKILSDEQWLMFKTQIAMGETVDFGALIETTEMAMGVNLLMNQLNYRFLMSRQKLERLLLRGDYGKAPNAL
jgi:hypothetical protein